MVTLKTGRQHATYACFSFTIDDFKNSAGTVVTTPVSFAGIPGGATVLPAGGFIVFDTAFNGTTPVIDVGDTTEGTPDVDKYKADADAATVDTMVTLTNVTAYQTEKPGFITMALSAADATAGAGRICIPMVLNNLATFSQS